MPHTTDMTLYIINAQGIHRAKIYIKYSFRKKLSNTYIYIIIEEINQIHGITHLFIPNSCFGKLPVSIYLCSIFQFTQYFATILD